MNIIPITFTSDTYTLDGSLYLPASDTGPYPTVIPCSGYQGFNCFYPKLFAEALCKEGIACLGFDYRGFAHSEGEPGKILLEEQLVDIASAIDYAQQRPELNAASLGLLGWGMGASHVLRSAHSPHVAAVAAFNGFYDGERWLSSIMDDHDYTQMLEEVAEDKKHRLEGAPSRLVDTFHHYPLDPNTQSNVEVELTSLHNFGEPVHLAFTESILALTQAELIESIRGKPVFLAHGKDNQLHPPGEARTLFDALSEPKQFYEIDGAHNDFMYNDHQEFKKLMDHTTSFFRSFLL